MNDLPINEKTTFTEAAIDSTPLMFVTEGVDKIDIKPKGKNKIIPREKDASRNVSICRKEAQP